MLSNNGSEHVLSSCSEENDAKEHLELGHCIDKAIVHDDNSVDIKNEVLRLSVGHFMSYRTWLSFLWLLTLPVFSFPPGCSLMIRCWVKICIHLWSSWSPSTQLK